MKFNDNNSVGFLISSKGKFLKLRLIELNPKSSKRKKNQADDLSHSILRKTRARANPHHQEVADWFIGFSKPAKDNQLTINLIYIGAICRRTMDRKPTIPGNHGLNSRVVHGELIGHTVTITDGITNSGCAIGSGKCFTLVPLNHIQICFTGAACGKSQAMKSLIQQFPILKDKK